MSDFQWAIRASLQMLSYLEKSISANQWELSDKNGDQTGIRQLLLLFEWECINLFLKISVNLCSKFLRTFFGHRFMQWSP